MHSIIFVLIFYLSITKKFCIADPHEDLFGSGTVSKGKKIKVIFMISDDQIYKLSIRFETMHFLVRAVQPRGNSWLNWEQFRSFK